MALPFSTTVLGCSWDSCCAMLLYLTQVNCNYQLTVNTLQTKHRSRCKLWSIGYCLSRIINITSSRQPITWEGRKCWTYAWFGNCSHNIAQLSHSISARWPDLHQDCDPPLPFRIKKKTSTHFLQGYQRPWYTLVHLLTLVLAVPIVKVVH